MLTGALGTVTVTPADGVSRLPLSSTARLLIFIEPEVKTVQLYVQLSRPLAGCHVCPPSSEISTPPTTPPPESAAFPAIVTAFPSCSVAPFVGAAIVELGGVVSVDFEANTNPACN